MKRIIGIFAVMAFAVGICSAQTFKENFETGMPSSAPSSDTKVTLSSGEWTINKTYGKKDNNSMRATMSQGGYVITPTLDRPGTITFYHRASGSGKHIVVEKSIDGGTSWTQIGEATVSSSTPYGMSSCNANSAEDDTQVLIKFTNKDGSTIYLDDVTINVGSGGSSGGGGGDEPVNPGGQPEEEWTGPHPTEHVIYIAPNGNDATGDGTWENPYYNLQKAVDLVEAGDTIYVRGGTYYPNMKKDGEKTTVRIEKNGTADKMYTIKTFPTEFPVLNFKDQPKKVSVRGIQLNGDYWHIYGLHITQAGDNGIKLEGSHNIIERCTFSYNDDTGLQLGFGHKFSDTHPGISSNDGSYCAYNDVIDCDSYLNCDADNYGSDADGFACKMHNGIGNRFIRCRAWDNADDAWDLYETDFAVKMIECWAWGSGRAELFTWVDASGSFQGNGNGIKLGGNGTGGSSKGIHEAWRCVAFNCNKTGSVKGFDENSHKGGVKLVNCLAFGNGYDYMFEDCDGADKFSFYNNVCLGKLEIKGQFTDSNNALLIDPKNAWKNNALTSGFSADDYFSLTEEDAKAPRAKDGSMPTRFARLKHTSALLDKGLDLKSEMQDEFPFTWQPIGGDGRDLGPYEYDEPVSTGAQLIIGRNVELSLSINNGNIVFTTPKDGRARVDILSLQGNKVGTIANLLATEGGVYTIPVEQKLKQGVYIVRLTFDGKLTKSVKMAVR